MTKLKIKRAYYAVAGLLAAVFGLASFLSIMQFAFSHSEKGSDGSKVWVRDAALENLISSKDAGVKTEPGRRRRWCSPPNV